MCEICRMTSCPQGCPNSPEPPVVTECENCGENIYDGDEYYVILDTDLCESCVCGGYRTAEI